MKITPSGASIIDSPNLTRAEKSRRFRLAHPGADRTYYEANRERIRAQQAEKYATDEVHREAVKSAAAKRYVVDPARTKRQAAAWDAAHPEAKDRIKRKHGLKRYGLTLAQYDELLIAQGGGCALCNREDDGAGHRLHVDHDHQTGRVRGLLCLQCNTKLAWVEKFGLLEIATYLETKEP